MNRMNKKLFSAEIRRLVQEQLGEEYRVELREINKNNNVKLQGLLILTEESNVTPTIYLDNFYEAYRNGTGLRAIREVILQIYREDTPKRRVNMDFFKDFEEVKDRICYRLINREYNEALLEKIPYVPFLDLALCFYYAYRGEELGEGSILIYNSHMEMWGTSTAELMRLAEENTQRIFPWELCPMEQVLRDLLGGEEDEEPEHPASESDPVKILSNQKRVYGAACMLYPKLLEQIAEGTDKGMYILPSSIHEVILLPETCEEDRADLAAVIREVNRTQLETQEVLSDNLYYYDPIRRNIQIFKNL